MLMTLRVTLGGLLVVTLLRVLLELLGGLPMLTLSSLLIVIEYLFSNILLDILFLF